MRPIIINNKLNKHYPDYQSAYLHDYVKRSEIRLRDAKISGSIIRTVTSQKSKLDREGYSNILKNNDQESIINDDQISDFMKTYHKDKIFNLDHEKIKERNIEKYFKEKYKIVSEYLGDPVLTEFFDNQQKIIEKMNEDNNNIRCLKRNRTDEKFALNKKINNYHRKQCSVQDRQDIYNDENNNKDVNPNNDKNDNNGNNIGNIDGNSHNDGDSHNDHEYLSKFHKINQDIKKQIDDEYAQTQITQNEDFIQFKSKLNNMFQSDIPNHNQANYHDYHQAFTTAQDLSNNNNRNNSHIRNHSHDQSFRQLEPNSKNLNFLNISYMPLSNNNTSNSNPPSSRFLNQSRVIDKKENDYLFFNSEKNGLPILNEPKLTDNFLNVKMNIEKNDDNCEKGANRPKKIVNKSKSPHHKMFHHLALNLSNNNNNIPATTPRKRDRNMYLELVSLTSRRKNECIPTNSPVNSFRSRFLNLPKAKIQSLSLTKDPLSVKIPYKKIKFSHQKAEKQALSMLSSTSKIISTNNKYDISHENAIINLNTDFDDTIEKNNDIHTLTISAEPEKSLLLAKEKNDHSRNELEIFKTTPTPIAETASTTMIKSSRKLFDLSKSPDDGNGRLVSPFNLHKTLNKKYEEDRQDKPQIKLKIPSMTKRLFIKSIKKSKGISVNLLDQKQSKWI